MRRKKGTRSWGMPLINAISTEGKRRLLKMAVLVLVIAAGVGGLVYGFCLLRGSVKELPEYRIKASDLRLIKGPEWMTPEIIAGLDITGDLPEEFSVLDSDIAKRIAEAYGRKIWVKRVLRVVKRYPGPEGEGSPIEVYLEFRRPLAFVAVGSRFYLVDAEGVRLPGVYHQPRLGDSEFFVINGVEGRVPEPGQRWLAPSIQAAMKVASVLASRRPAFRLASIDVGNIGGRRDARASEVAIFTEHQTRIDWGKPPGPSADILDKPVAEKVAYLDYVYQKFGGKIDGELVYVDIPNETVCRRPTPNAY